MSLAELKQAVSDLSEQERGKLALWLLDSLPPNSGKDAAEEGVEEAARRREEWDSGKTKGLSSKEFWASIERERSTWK